MLEQRLSNIETTDEVRAFIMKTLEQYREYQDVIENGELHTIMSPCEDGGKSAGYYMSEDGDYFVAFFYQSEGETPTEYRLKIDVPDGTVWTAPFNRHSPYYSYDLKNTGLVVRSTAEGRHAEVYYFYRDKWWDPKSPEKKPMFEKWVSDEKMSGEAAAALAEKIRGNERFEKIVREFECKKITTVEGDKEAYLFRSENNHEFFVFFYQPKGETPKEYRLRIDVPSSVSWTATLNRDCDYHSWDFFSGLIVRSSEEDGYAEIFHFIR